MESLLLKDYPYKDELLSSWLTRIAKLNYLTLTGFMGKYFKDKKYSKYDLDLCPLTKKFLKQTSILTEIKTNNIKRLQLFKYEGYIMEKISANYRHKWITPLHSINKKNKFLCTRACPKCLKENVYYKNIWRMLFVNICPKHKCYLINSCPICNSIIDYSKIKYNIPLNHCYMCGHDLISSKNLEKVPNHEYCIQNELLKIASKKYFIFQEEIYNTFDFFHLLRILSRNVLKNHTSINENFIERLTPTQLSNILYMSMNLLNNYPKNLNNFRKKNNLLSNSKFFDKDRFIKKSLIEKVINNT